MVEVLDPRMLDVGDAAIVVVFEATDVSTDEAEDAVDRDVCEAETEELDGFVACPLPVGKVKPPI